MVFSNVKGVLAKGSTSIPPATGASIPPATGASIPPATGASVSPATGASVSPGEAIHSSAKQSLELLRPDAGRMRIVAIW
jgi:hypothetical protein